MSTIMISDLHFTSDSEGYLNDLTETEQNIQGGIWPILPYVLMGAGAIGIGASLGVMAARALHN